MKKFLLTLVAIVATMVAQAATTSYTDKLVVTINGESTPPQDATITVDDKGNGLYDLSLKNFKLGAEDEVLNVGDINLTNVTGTTTAKGMTTMTTTQTIQIAAGDDPNVADDEWLGPMLGDVPVSLTAYTMNGKIYCTIDIDMQATLEQTIGVTLGTPRINPVNSMNEVAFFEVTTGKTADLPLTISGLGIAASDIHAAIQTTSDLQQNAFSIKQNGESLTLYFNPTVAGTHTATITLTAEGADDVIVKVTGTAKAPALVLSASTDELDFGDLKTGESATKTFTVTTENLTADVMLNMLGSDAFTVSPAVIPISSTSTEVTVTYTAGTSAATAQLNISTEAGEQTAKFVTVKLNGGVKKAIDNIADIDFGTVHVGQTVTKKVTVTASGVTSLISTLQTITSAQAQPFSLNTTQITPGDELEITFAPTVAGPHSARVILNNNEVGANFVVSGTAVESSVTASTDHLNFGTVTEGESKTMTFTVNTLNLNGDVTLEIDNTAAFSVSPNVIVIGKEGNTTISVTYTAGSEPTTGLLTIRDHSTNGTLTYVKLDGGAIPTAIEGIAADNTANVNVYSISGTLLRKNVPAATALQGLAKGIYLVNGKKVMK